MELRDELLSRHGDDDLCPPCFQAKIIRLTREIRHGNVLGKRKKPNFFNVPVVLTLFTLLFLLTLGPRQCSHPGANPDEVQKGAVIGSTQTP